MRRWTLEERVKQAVLLDDINFAVGEIQIAG